LLNGNIFEVVIVTSWGIGIRCLVRWYFRVYLVSWVEAATASLQQQNATKQYYKWACLKCTHTILSFPTYKINKHQPFPGVFRPFFLLKHLHAIRTPWTCKCFVLPPSHGADPSQHINFFAPQGLKETPHGYRLKQRRLVTEHRIDLNKTTLVG